MSCLEKIFIGLGRIEGVSLLALFFYAMPVKYILGNPEPVRLIGAIHGGLFLAYGAFAFAMMDRNSWSGRKLGTCLILSTLPFGTFYFERKKLGSNRSSDNTT